MTRTLTNEVRAIEYRHEDDGIVYRHDFAGPGARATLANNGTVTIARPGKPLWDLFDMGDRSQPFLINPPREARMATKKRRKSVHDCTRCDGTGLDPYLKAKPGPYGRPAIPYACTRCEGTGTDPKSVLQSHNNPPNGGTTMAAKRRKKARKAVTARRNPPKRKRAAVHHFKAARRVRRNPPVLGLSSATTVAMDGVRGAVAGVAGIAIVRQTTKSLGMVANSTKEAAVQALVALGLGVIGPRFVPRGMARDAMVGGFMAPLQSFLGSLTGVPQLAALMGATSAGGTTTVFPAADTPRRRVAQYSRSIQAYGPDVGPVRPTLMPGSPLSGLPVSAMYGG